MISKSCRICKEVKSLAEFAVQRSGRDGHRTYCKVCGNKLTKDYYERIGKRNRLGEKLRCKEKAAGVPRPIYCPVCGSTKTICFDHNHATGKFRGWICNACNRALGFSRDNPLTLRRLADYLEGKIKCR